MEERREKGRKGGSHSNGEKKNYWAREVVTRAFGVCGAALFGMKDMKQE